jgi:hypothetical protein
MRLDRVDPRAASAALRILAAAEVLALDRSFGEAPADEVVQRGRSEQLDARLDVAVIHAAAHTDADRCAWVKLREAMTITGKVLKVVMRRETIEAPRLADQKTA